MAVFFQWRRLYCPRCGRHQTVKPLLTVGPYACRCDHCSTCMKIELIQYPLPPVGVLGPSEMKEDKNAARL